MTTPTPGRGCSWCMRTPTTRASRTASRWPSTPPRAPRPPSAPARSARRVRCWSRACPSRRPPRGHLGPHRIGELADAMRILGVTDQRFLGGAGRYRTPAWPTPRALSPCSRPSSATTASGLPDLFTASNDLVEVIREVRPQVLITYDELGWLRAPRSCAGTPHLDMGSRPRSSCRRTAPISEPAWNIPKVYWSATSESRMRDGLRKLRASDTAAFEGWDPDGPLPAFVVPTSSSRRSSTDTTTSTPRSTR